MAATLCRRRNGRSQQGGEVGFDVASLEIFPEFVPQNKWTCSISPVSCFTAAAKAKYTFDDDDDDSDDMQPNDVDDGFAVGGAAKDSDSDDDWQKELSDDDDFGPSQSSQNTKG